MSRSDDETVVREAPINRTEHGLVPGDDGWFVVNAREAQWMRGRFGAYTRFEGEARFPQLGVNIGVLEPGQPACMYHGEADQEDFLVLSGECLLLIEGRERRLRAWDFVHCPPWTEHVFVGAGGGPCAILAVGTRLRDVQRRRHVAGPDPTPDTPLETHDPREAYADVAPDVAVSYRDGWLPG